MGIRQKERLNLGIASWKPQLCYRELWSWDNSSGWSLVGLRGVDFSTPALFSNQVQGLSSTKAVSLHRGRRAEGCLRAAWPAAGTLLLPFWRGIWMAHLVFTMGERFNNHTLGPTRSRTGKECCGSWDSMPSGSSHGVTLIVCFLVKKKLRRWSQLF